MGESAAPGAAPQEEAALDRVLAEVAGITGSHAAGVFLLVPHAQALRLAVVTGLSAGAVRPWSRLALATPAPVSVVAREGHPVWVHGHDELARRFPRTAFALPYRVAMYVVPLHTGTTVSGVLQLLWPDTRPDRLAPDERAAVTRAADRMSGLLTRAAARGRPLRPGAVPRVLAPDPPPPVPPAEAQAAAELTERLNEGVLALDLEGRVTFLNSRAAELLGRDKRQLMHTRLWESLPWLIDPAYEDPYLAALFSRLPTDFTALRPPDDWLSFRLYPDTTGISIRLRTAPAPAGNRLPPTTPSGTAPTRAGALYHLLYIASSLTEAVGVRDVAASVTEQIMPVLGADGLSLLITDEGRFQDVASRGFPRDHKDFFRGLSLTVDTAGSRTVATGTPMFFSDVDAIRQAFPLVTPYTRMGAWAFLPLNASGRTIGCCVLAFALPRAFPPDERAALTSLAGMIAQALERARLYDTKSQVARTLQTALLPHSLPHVAGLRVAARYLPAASGMDIGGDFYDLIRLDGSGAAAAVIGDVQGHSVSAAALMGQIRTAVHTHASTGAAPDDVLTRINRLFSDFDTDLFTSCLYAQLDVPGHRALLASAGHLPALLRHSSGRTEILDVPPGLLLGVDVAADYRAAAVPMPPGSVLTLFTDGLIERPGTDLETALRELAGRLAVAPVGSLDDLADELLREAQRTSGGRDDIALLLVGPGPAPGG
ncbi:SpoIIE family protein phosphatase [Actinacidiphila glaucinigra]|uniref:SpoIIE family protein phosphatase n=1 Tax=Actinacidiphila glaucinigra TaxID=235986 RepID=UPI0033A4DFA8